MLEKIHSVYEECLQQFNSQNQTVNLINVGAIPAAPTKYKEEIP